MSTRVGVLGIVGSPRHNGNTNCLVDTALRGAEEAGATTRKVFVADYSVAPCKACGACLKTGRCVSRDGMDELVPLLQESRVWVLGTPVYWWGPTAQMKVFVDRWFAPWVLPKTRAMFDKRLAVVLTCLGDTDPAVARHTTGMFTDILEFLRIPIVATVVAHNVGDSGISEGVDVASHPDVLAQARDAGRAAVERAGRPS